MNARTAVFKISPALAESSSDPGVRSPPGLHGPFDGVRSILEVAVWRFVYAAPWKNFVHITNAELRTAVFSVKRILRRVENFGCKHLVLSDSMASILCLCKGRSSAATMLKSIRAISSLILASGIVLRARWLPSELNPSDGASRRGWHANFCKQSFTADLSCLDRPSAIRTRGNADTKAAVAGSGLDQWHLCHFGSSILS